MTRLSTIVCIVAASSMLPAVTYAGDQSVAAMKFHAKYGALTSVECAFTDANGMKVAMKAQRGGQYRVSMPDHEIVCDSRTVWNATASARTVIVNAYTPTSEDLSLERVFFLILSVYQPTVVSDGPKGSVIQLVPPRQDAVVANVTRAEIAMDAASKITRITVTENGSTSTWKIDKLRTGVKFPASTFSYKVPAGWQLVDLR